MTLVSEGSPAKAAGIRGTPRGASGTGSEVVDVTLGDIIVGMDDVDINSESDLFRALDGHKVGDRVKIRLLRAVVDSKKQTNPETLMAVKREEVTVNLVLGQKAE